MSGAQDVWIDRTGAPADSNVLVTLSGPSGEKTVLVTSDVIVESSAKLFVTTPPERVITKNDLRKAKLVYKIRNAFDVSPRDSPSRCR